jgi:hypothetical protein
MFTKSVFTSLQLTKLMFLLGIAQSKVSHVIHEHVPSIKKGNACNVSCIERHVGCGGTRVLQVLQGAGFMLDKNRKTLMSALADCLTFILHSWRPPQQHLKYTKDLMSLMSLMEVRDHLE